MVTNNAAALILWPISLAMATQMGVSWMPFAFAIMMGASASFATPIGYQCNMMVFGPGGYRFSDFLKIGVPHEPDCLGYYELFDSHYVAVLNRSRRAFGLVR